jgi:hypothetical protein
MTVIYFMEAFGETCENLRNGLGENAYNALGTIAIASLFGLAGAAKSIGDGMYLRTKVAAMSTDEREQYFSGLNPVSRAMAKRIVNSRFLKGIENIFREQE